MNSLFTFEELLPHAENKLKANFNSEIAKIFLVREDSSELIHYLADKTKEIFPLNKGSIAGNTAFTKQFESYVSAYSHFLFNGKIDIDTPLPIISMPLFNKNKEIVGVLQVINTKGIETTYQTKKSKISPREFEQLEFFAEQTVQSILNVYEIDKLRKNNFNNLKRFLFIFF